VDDHQMFGQALQRLLEGEDDLQVTGVVRSAEEALSICGLRGADVVLMDVDIPGMDGITAISGILKNCPGAQVVVVTALHDPTLLTQAVDAGAAGFLSKSEAIADLVSVVRRAAKGDIVLPPTGSTRSSDGSTPRACGPSRQRGYRTDETGARGSPGVRRRPRSRRRR
jgi:DNA-binding NarL/FixJ family response regulator